MIWEHRIWICRFYRNKLSIKSPSMLKPCCADPLTRHSGSSMEQVVSSFRLGRELSTSPTDNTTGRKKQVSASAQERSIATGLGFNELEENPGLQPVKIKQISHSGKNQMDSNGIKYQAQKWIGRQQMAAVISCNIQYIPIFSNIIQ